MITNEERREVAARLRETILTEGAAVIEERKGLEPAVASRFVAIPNLVAALNFDKAIVSMRELTDRLADLIEPEPERTCKFIPFIEDDGSVFIENCSECDAAVLSRCEFNYCPNCGARVTEVVS